MSNGFADILSRSVPFSQVSFNSSFGRNSANNDYRFESSSAGSSSERVGSVFKSKPSPKCSYVSMEGHYWVVNVLQKPCDLKKGATPTCVAHSCCGNIVLSGGLGLCFKWLCENH